MKGFTATQRARAIVQDPLAQIHWCHHIATNLKELGYGS